MFVKFNSLTSIMCSIKANVVCCPSPLMICIERTSPVPPSCLFYLKDFSSRNLICIFDSLIGQYVLPTLSINQLLR